MSQIQLVDQQLSDTSANPANLQDDAAKMTRLHFSAYRYKMINYYREKSGAGKHVILLISVSTSLDWTAWTERNQMIGDYYKRLYKFARPGF